MKLDEQLARRAVESWQLSPVTSLLVRWLMPAVGDLIGDLVCEHLDEVTAPAPPREPRPAGGRYDHLLPLLLTMSPGESRYVPEAVARRRNGVILTRTSGGDRRPATDTFRPRTHAEMLAARPILRRERRTAGPPEGFPDTPEPAVPRAPNHKPADQCGYLTGLTCNNPDCSEWPEDA